MKIRVILLEPEKAGNVGAVARLMRNFDLDDLWVVNPKTHIDGEARAFAMHGLPILESARFVRSMNESLEGVNIIAGTSSVDAKSASNISRISVTPKELAEKVRVMGGTIAIVLGRESSGLNNHEVNACDLIVTIPASQFYNVLNVANAAAIMFYELFRQQQGRSAKIEIASRTVMRRAQHDFETLVTRCGIPPHKSRLTKRAFRNIMSRALVSKREASLLLGVLRKASQKVV